MTRGKLAVCRAASHAFHVCFGAFANNTVKLPNFVGRGPSHRVCKATTTPDRNRENKWIHAQPRWMPVGPSKEKRILSHERRRSDPPAASATPYPFLVGMLLESRVDTKLPPEPERLCLASLLITPTKGLVTLFTTSMILKILRGPVWHETVHLPKFNPQ